MHEKHYDKKHKKSNIRKMKINVKIKLRIIYSYTHCAGCANYQAPVGKAAAHTCNPICTYWCRIRFYSFAVSSMHRGGI